MGENDKRIFYAVIPAVIRYDKSLSPNAKLLYGEITALSNEKGYCWASNDYFARLYNVHKKTIGSWVSLLHKKGYVTVEVLRDSKTNEVLGRNIWITRSSLAKNERYPLSDNVNTSPQKCEDTHQQIMVQNNTSINIKNENKRIFSELKNVRLTDEEYSKLCKRFGKRMAEDNIENLSLYMASKGKSFKSHYATLLNWMKRAHDQNRPDVTRLPEW